MDIHTSQSKKFKESCSKTIFYRYSLLSILIQVSTKSESLEYLYFLQSVLGPYVEGYWLSACNLVRLLDQDGPEKDFADQVNTYAKDRVAKGLALYGKYQICFTFF